MIRAGLVLVMAVILLYPQAAASCGSATMGSCSTAGVLDWESGNPSFGNTYKFCDGTDWIAMKGSGTLGACSNAGDLEYDTSNATLKFCDGTDWIPVANNGTLGSCSNAGDKEYDTTNNVMKFCNGTNWIDMSAGSDCTVFVTSQTFGGGLIGSVSNADTECQNLADAAGLSGTYKAWIADSLGNTPANDFTRASVDYVLVDGTVVANGWSDLTDGALDNHINVDENGTTRTDQIYTGTDDDGTYGTTCNDWDSEGGQGFATIGNNDTDVSTTYWTNIGTKNCGYYERLYCFEQ